MLWSKNILSSAYRMCLSGSWCQRSITTAATPLCFRLTQVVGAEPLKKKKKMDPQIIRQRDERRKKKIEKSIRRLEKNAGQLKPLDELEVPRNIHQEIDIRKRATVSMNDDVEDQYAALSKAWARYKYHQHRAEVAMIDRVAAARDRAIQELREESEELWLEAIQIDTSLLPYKAKGPILTLPIPDYNMPDGEYINVTKIWE